MNIKERVEEKRAYIKANYFVKEIGIFGSFVKGAQHQYSDVDILVEFEKGHKDFFNYMRLKHYLESLLDRKVDLVTKNAIKPMLREQILREVEYV